METKAKRNRSERKVHTEQKCRVWRSPCTHMEPAGVRILEKSFSLPQRFPSVLSFSHSDLNRPLPPGSVHWLISASFNGKQRRATSPWSFQIPPCPQQCEKGNAERFSPMRIRPRSHQLHSRAWAPVFTFLAGIKHFVEVPQQVNDGARFSTAADFSVWALGHRATWLFHTLFQVTYLSTARNFLSPLLWTCFIKQSTSKKAQMLQPWGFKNTTYLFQLLTKNCCRVLNWYCWCQWGEAIFQQTWDFTRLLKLFS